MDIAKFFSNLADLPIFEVCRHLDYHGLTLVSLASDKWKWAVESGKMRMESVWNVEISGETVSIYLKFSEQNRNFSICFKPDEEGKIESGSNFIIYYSPSIEDTCISTLQLISYLFPPSYDHITVSLGSSDTHFPFLFLSLLPLGSARYVNIQADREVDGAHLTRFLERVTVENDRRRRDFVWNQLILQVKVKDVVMSDKILIKNSIVEVADARFLTRQSLLNLDAYHAEFGENSFSEEDLIAFVREWLGRRWSLMRKVTFGIRKDIEIEKVLEGLNAQFGRPSGRDRYWLEFQPDDAEGHSPPTAIDCQNAWEVYHNDKLATLLFTPNQLICVYWNNLHAIDAYTLMYKSFQEHYISGLEMKRIQKLEIEERIRNEGVRSLKDEEELDEKVECILFQEKYLEQCNVILELFAKWSTDE